MAAAPDAGADSISPALVKAALQLKTSGYAVIESVISPEESERYIDRCWSWLESLGTGKSLSFYAMMMALCRPYVCDPPGEEHVCACRHLSQQACNMVE